MVSFKSIITSFVIGILTFFLISCASSSDPIYTKVKGLSVIQIYTKANNELSEGDYTDAIKLYDYLINTYPASSYTAQSMLNLAYSYYQNDKADMALITLDQFLLTYPDASNVDYAYYLKGEINNKPKNDFFDNLTTQDLSLLDSQSASQAYQAFTTVYTQYPNSVYAAKAKQKASILLTTLAENDLNKARYYMRIKAYLAALNRAHDVIVTYPKNKAVEEALAIQVVAYKALGQNDAALDVSKVLRLNYPHSKYLNKDWVYEGGHWYSLWS